MLKRIEHIKGTGLLHNANGKPYEFHKATLVYAENGRGKSTLSSVLRSCATGDVSLVINRKTLDGTEPQDVVLQLDNGHKVNFTNGAWSAIHPELVVFDSDFVEKNVYSGGQVSTEHRKNLLDFALGTSAVTARKRVDVATESVKTITTQVSAIEASLKGYHAGISLAEFEKLQPVADADQQISALQKRIAATANNEALQKKSAPSQIPIPSFDIDSLFTILNTTLEDVEADAEKIVRQHITNHGGSQVENWISQGQQYEKADSCPYCAQSLKNVDLIKAYRTHFNQAYSDLKNKVSQLSVGVDTRTSDQVIEQFASALDTVNAVIDGWAEHVKYEKIAFDKEALLERVRELRGKLANLAKLKEQSPLESVGSPEEKQEATAIWESILSTMEKCNQAISGVGKDIDDFKIKLNTENAQQIQAQIVKLELTKKRQEQQVADLISKLTTARASKVTADKEKVDAKDALNKLMKATLDKYCEAINKLLINFGASFEIAKLDFNYYGLGVPRTEYGLLLRGKEVSLSGGVPDFRTALSDGDKRTLAFAFFVASIQSDPDINKKIVVIDDPISSLDHNRRRQTRTILKKIYDISEQLIVFAHDLYFLRDLRDDLLDKAGQIPTQTIKLKHAQGGYSDFDSLNIDKECEAAYFRHHRLLDEFLNGVSTADHHDIAKAIRPMLEGYLHRRFPARISKGLLFGQIVQIIKDAQLPNPLAHAQGLVDELNEINSYAGQFHHDTNPAADTVVVIEAELRTFTTRALNLVHKGTV